MSGPVHPDYLQAVQALATRGPLPVCASCGVADRLVGDVIVDQHPAIVGVSLTRRGPALPPAARTASARVVATTCTACGASHAATAYARPFQFVHDAGILLPLRDAAPRRSAR